MRPQNVCLTHWYALKTSVDSKIVAWETEWFVSACVFMCFGYKSWAECSV